MEVWESEPQDPFCECSLYNLSHVYKQRRRDLFPYTEGCQIWTSHQLVASPTMKAKKPPSTCGPIYFSSAEASPFKQAAQPPQLTNHPSLQRFQ